MAKSLDWIAARTEAERVPCPHCHAPIGYTCRNHITGQEIHGLPAHTPRIKLAHQTPEPPY